jgi:uncharacterized membrane protein YphA (DoxX/SURF4 family)
MQFFEKLKPLALLALRLALGLVFFFHGYEKLAGNSAEARAAFAPLGLPPFFFYVLGTLELFGALLLVLGLLTRVTGLVLAIEMGYLLAQVSVPRGGIYAVPNYELPLALFAGTFALAATGAGLLSLDAFSFERGAKSRSKTKS